MKKADFVKWYVQDILFSDIVPELSDHWPTPPDALFKKRKRQTEDGESTPDR
jgi:hypothetical protein